MNSVPPAPSEFPDEDDPRVVAAVKQFMERLEAGQTPNVEQFLADQGSAAEALRPAVEGLALLHGAAGKPARRTADADAHAHRDADADFAALPIGDFHIIRELGRGGMGIVYEAIQLSLGRRVALKVLPFASSLDASRLQRFRNEAHAAAQLHHTHIVPVYAVGSDRGLHYYAMQLIDGQTLADVIAGLRAAASVSLPASGPPHRMAGRVADRAGGEAATASFSRLASDSPPPPTRSRAFSTTRLTHSGPRHAHYRTMVQLASQAALAVEHAHQYGVVHRDIKPGNLLLDTKGKLWVTDFGLAQIEHAEAQLTRSGDALGTVRYMSPEQAAGNRLVLDHRTDIYSLGVTLYEMLTLQPAISGHDYRAMLNQVIDHEPPPPRAVDPQLPVELDTIIRKAIAKDPSARYASAQALADDLMAWLDDKPIAAKPPTWWQWLGKWRKRNRRLVNVAAGLLVLACLGMLATTLLVVREQRRTYQALQAESRQRAAAEASFQQARRAVDTFSALSETELAYRPEFQSLRRRILETSLDFYRDFVARRAGGSSDSLELQEASAKVQQMVDELKLLDEVALLLQLEEQRVRRELQLDSSRASGLLAEIEALQAARASLGDENSPLLAGGNSEIAARLREFVTYVHAELDESQLERLRQIWRQRQLPFSFLTPEVADALQLTNLQRQQIGQIIAEERPDRRGPPNGPPRDPPHPPLAPDGPRRPGMGPPHDLPPGPPLGRGEDGPWRASRRGDEGFPGRGGGGTDFASLNGRTVTRILGVLTLEQQARWRELIGPPMD